MTLSDWTILINTIGFGKILPVARYIARPDDWQLVTPALAATVERAMHAAGPNPAWNLLKLHTDQIALTFLTYPDFDSDPHPALAEATKVNLNTGTVVRTDYRTRANPPILHRKETFLPNDDPRYTEFAALTQAEEAVGLLRGGSRIGLRQYWLSLVRRHGLTFEGHQLIAIRPSSESASANDAPSPDLPPLVERHRTAIKRYDLSKPVKLALDRGILTQNRSFFDYGCGHGMDIEALGGLGFDAFGWDPAFRPDAERREADLVNLGYVLNVIDDADERTDALRNAFALARHALIVSTLVAGQETVAHSRPFKDGFLTKSNTFQKFYAPGELESLIESVLEAEVITLALGVCVAFKNPDDAELFEASRSRRRIDWTEISAQLKFSTPSVRESRRLDRYDLHRELFDAYWQCLLDLGRPPEPGEFDQLDEVRRTAGGAARAQKLVIDKNGESHFLRARRERKEDTLVYLAMTNFRRKFLRRDIPLRIQRDIKSFLGDLALAKSQARDLLFGAGDSGEVERAVEGLTFGVFDRDEMQFTFHRSRLDQLPPVLRIYVQCGATRYGNPTEADLIKIHIRSGKLTFLHYDNFENKKEPILLTRIKINLRTQFVQVFDHANEKSLLADKDRFLKGR